MLPADTRPTPTLRYATALRNLAWLLLLGAILQRYVFKVGSAPRDVTVITVGLLIVALVLRIAAWRLTKARRK